MRFIIDVGGGTLQTVIQTMGFKWEMNSDKQPLLI